MSSNIKVLPVGIHEEDRCIYKPGEGGKVELIGYHHYAPSALSATLPAGYLASIEKRNLPGGAVVELPVFHDNQTKAQITDPAILKLLHSGHTPALYHHEHGKFYYDAKSGFAWRPNEKGYLQPHGYFFDHEEHGKELSLHKDMNHLSRLDKTEEECRRHLDTTIGLHGAFQPLGTYNWYPVQQSGNYENVKRVDLPTKLALDAMHVHHFPHQYEFPSEVVQKPPTLPIRPFAGNH